MAQKHSWVYGRQNRSPNSLCICLLVLLSLVVTSAFSLQHSQAAQVQLAWDPSPSPGILGYKVHYGTASRSYSQHVDVGLSAGCLIGDLLQETIYYFAVTAYNGSAESDYSAEIVYGVSANWRQFRYGPAHRGFNPYENILSSSTVAGLQGAWNYSTGGILLSSPAVANGILYVGPGRKALCPACQIGRFLVDPPLREVRSAPPLPLSMGRYTWALRTGVSMLTSIDLPALLVPAASNWCGTTSETVDGEAPSHPSSPNVQGGTGSPESGQI